jgi:hypothetical protein
MFDIGDKIFDYPRSQVEDLVDQFVRRRPFIGDDPPIEVDLILKRMPDIRRMEPGPILLPQFKTEAMVLSPIFMHRALTVVVDQQIMDQRDGAPYNMAIAEEIGHIELHRSVILEIESPEDFVDIQRNPRWAIAERDAKYFGRALLMPRSHLHPATERTYKYLAIEFGFADKFQFWCALVAKLAAMFEIPLADAERRINEYPGGLKSRFEASMASASCELLPLSQGSVRQQSTSRPAY